MTEGVLEVGINEHGEVVVNHPDLQPDANGVGHIIFSPAQARSLADLLSRKAAEAEADARQRREAGQREAAAAIPVDRGNVCTTNGQPAEAVRANQTNETGQHDGYIVLCAEERAQGFVRPYRDAYQHKTCGTVTTMGRALSETYARDPKFYSATFCVRCNRHLPVAEFVWTLDGQQVGS
jgi:hypothetical protein